MRSVINAPFELMLMLPLFFLKKKPKYKKNKKNQNIINEQRDQK
jgi:hypothetical protein